MMNATPGEIRFRHAFLILLVASVSVAFVVMLRGFLLTLVLAAIFSASAYPIYSSLLLRLRHPPLAAATTLLVVLTLVLLPLTVVTVVGANEALRLAEDAGPRVQAMMTEPGNFDRWLRGLPGYERLLPFRAQVLAKVGEGLGDASTFALTLLSGATVATAVFVFHAAVMLYTMYFFLTVGPRLLRGGLNVLPLAESDKQRMLDTFVSVTRATLKGTVLIGAAQGALGGVAFWVAGIDGAVLWGLVMTVLSIVPGVGGALVWLPASVALILSGDVWRGLALASFCGLVVGSIDNLLRARLVGRDTQLHELLIFFSTLGGLVYFGAAGFILGPIMAALFVTVWEMFGAAFRREIGEPASAIVGPDSLPPS